MPIVAIPAWNAQEVLPPVDIASPTSASRSPYVVSLSDLVLRFGEFQGVLPKRRTFEFKVRDADTVITGKIGPAISDADTLNEHLHTPTRVELLVTRVGNGRPRYVLSEMPEWHTAKPSGAV